MRPRSSATLLSASLAAFVAATLALAAPEPTRLLFTGDVLLTRQVALEIARTGRSPWDPFASLFAGASWVAGNFEGAVGREEDCAARAAKPAGPCFAIRPDLVPLLAKAGFRAMTLANNHAADLGEAGRERTRSALRQAGIVPLELESSPRFLRFGRTTVAVVAVSLVPGRDGKAEAIPSPLVRQKLRLASRLASFTVVLVHWGSELLDWPSTAQRRAAEWFVKSGASLVVGHHPHVVQPPECVGGRPVFFSLGNHLFDQKYLETKEGLIADCRIESGSLSCGSLTTQAPVGSSFPRLGPAGPAVGCAVQAGTPFRVNDFELRALDSEAGLSLEVVSGSDVRFRTKPGRLVSISAGRLAGERGPEMLLILERHFSPLDGEDGVRPYVYEVGPHGLVARWRGSGLAWPLIDATLIGERQDRLCALHRTDSFLVPNPEAKGTRTAVYRWNGFGFSAVDEPASLATCRAEWN